MPPPSFYLPVSLLVSKITSCSTTASLHRWWMVGLSQSGRVGASCQSGSPAGPESVPTGSQWQQKSVQSRGAAELSHLRGRCRGCGASCILSQREALPSVASLLCCCVAHTAMYHIRVCSAVSCSHAVSTLSGVDSQCLHRQNSSASKLMQPRLTVVPASLCWPFAVLPISSRGAHFHITCIQAC